MISYQFFYTFYEINIDIKGKKEYHLYDGDGMFFERLKDNFNNTEPIFTDEIIALFSDYSRAQVFRFIKTALRLGQIVRFDQGIYFIPQKTFFGTSTLSVDSIIEKRYLMSNDSVYGVYSGIKLLNAFFVTTQTAAVIEITTNNETSKKREITISGRRFILRRSRFRIDKGNAPIYMVLELFNNLTTINELDNLSYNKLVSFIRNNNISKRSLLDTSLRFPSKVTKNLIRSGVLNEIT